MDAQGQPIANPGALQSATDIAMAKTAQPDAPSGALLDASGQPMGRVAPYSIKDGFMTGSDGDVNLGVVRKADGQMVGTPAHDFRDDLPIRIEEGRKNQFNAQGTLLEKGYGVRHMGEGDSPRAAANKQRRLEEAGFQTNADLIDYVSKNYTQIYEQPLVVTGAKPRYLLVEPERNVALEVVEFRRANGEDYYGVTTAFAAGSRKYPSKKGTLIWSKEPTLARAPDTALPPESGARLASDNTPSSGTGGQIKIPDTSIGHVKPDLNPPTGGGLVDAQGRPLARPGADEPIAQPGVKPTQPAIARPAEPTGAPHRMTPDAPAPSPYKLGSDADRLHATLAERGFQDIAHAQDAVTRLGSLRGKKVIAALSPEDQAAKEGLKGLPANIRETTGTGGILSSLPL